ncbi:alpha-amylase/alpha-mannosidase [Desulfocurvibacter africanus PCS]|uniref:Alpha-amylase/alpha-mannosidase n=1 Tax=Desulfocurvibacter africanus PCS TaxID=1262666 RepID=M5PSM4_DESAF|nr:DUF3536 domain-containing protein [Desulfocurvibacter africanus]EMG37040.1 alpha-amylase/alpha-mannosidase [Desulfocurvibacter africanus PCS]
MSKSLCIHGHFYQPPREDPWLDVILPEGSAAPYKHWNERICRESYGPLAFARRMDGQGRITEIMNCYEWINFNVGPTLLRWMELTHPDVYARIVEGDRKSAERLGHGNAMAQVCHHVILPLASDLDKELQVAWGKADFERRFGRPPEGMWLAEAAVDTASLEVLAAYGIAYTVLAPRQAKAVRRLSPTEQQWTPAHEGSLDVTRPYLVRLPSGKSIAVFFYDGPLSQAVAFERLLQNGEGFWQRIGGGAHDGLRALATDGETYGHHFTFGEMALAYVLDQARGGRDGWSITNFGAYLAANPPTMEVQLHEPSSWSCVHGVERWRSDCGCSTGDHHGWNQQWRAPLRKALDLIKTRVDKHFFSRGHGLFTDSRAALVDYGRVYTGAADLEAFERQHFSPGLSSTERATGWKLLSMQQWALAAFASCAWFFDELSRIEPVNALSMALRSLDIGRMSGMPDLERLQDEITAILSRAVSNMPGVGTGADLWRREILPRCETPESLAAQAVLDLWGTDRLPVDGLRDTTDWPGVAVTLTGKPMPGRFAMSVQWARESGREEYDLVLHREPANDPMAWQVDIRGKNGARALATKPGALPWNKRQALAITWVEHAERTAWLCAVGACLPATAMFMPWQEAQTTQNAGNAWARLYSPLAWRYIVGDAPALGAEKDLVAFLSQAGRNNPAVLLLAQRVQERLLELLAISPLAAPGVITRAAAIGLSVDLYPAQNVYWQRRAELAVVQGLGKLLGFADA